LFALAAVVVSVLAFMNVCRRLRSAGPGICEDFPFGGFRRWEPFGKFIGIDLCGAVSKRNKS